MSGIREVTCDWSWAAGRVNPARMYEAEAERVEPCWKGRGRWVRTVRVDRSRVKLVKVESEKLLVVVLDLVPLFRCREGADWKLLMRQEGFIVA